MAVLFDPDATLVAKGPSRSQEDLASPRTDGAPEGRAEAAEEASPFAFPGDARSALELQQVVLERRARRPLPDQVAHLRIFDPKRGVQIHVERSQEERSPRP